MTKADKIRAMTDEELAKNISKLVRCPRCPIHEMCRSNYSTASCDEIICEWLKQESEGEDK